MSSIPEETIKIIYGLFFANAPKERKDAWKSNFVSIFSDVEYAYWYYLDGWIKNNNAVGVEFFEFCRVVFNHYPKLVPKKVKWEDKYTEWKRIRSKAPTASAIIIDEYFSMVLLVQGYDRSSWTFPGGKQAEGEKLIDTAVREAMEEIGLDIDNRVHKDLYFESRLGNTIHRAYIVEKIPRINQLVPSTKYEIEAITWFQIDNLPESPADVASVEKMNMKMSQFYFVIPFIKPLREYTRLRKSGVIPVQARNLALQTRHPRPANDSPLPSSNSESEASANRRRVIPPNRTIQPPEQGRNQKHASRADAPPNNAKKDSRLLLVDRSVDQNSIWGGRLRLNADSLVEFLVPCGSR